MLSSGSAGPESIEIRYEVSAKPKREHTEQVICKRCMGVLNFDHTANTFFYHDNCKTFVDAYLGHPHDAWDRLEEARKANESRAAAAAAEAAAEAAPPPKKKKGQQTLTFAK